MATNIVDTWIEEGIQQGTQKEKILVVGNLLKQGILAPEQIAKAVGVELSRVREMARLSSSP